MNTWLFEQLLAGDTKTDEELVAAWLEREFDGPQPKEAVEVLLEADDIADKGIQWGGGVTARRQFDSLHTTKLTWLFAGFIDPEFPYKMADPTLETIEGLIAMKHDAHERARRNIARIKAARAAMHPQLFDELVDGYTTFADCILLARDWHSYVLMQYAIERGVVPADRGNLARMSRCVEQFIVNMLRLRDSASPASALMRMNVPDPFVV